MVKKEFDVTMVLGQRMLIGWTLLDVVCAACRVVPLVEDKKRNFTECVQCKRTFKRENGDLIETTPPPPATQQLDNSNQSLASSASTVAVVPTKQEESYRDIDKEEYNETRSKQSNSIVLPQLSSSTNQQKQQTQLNNSHSINSTKIKLDDYIPKNIDKNYYYDDYQEEDDQPMTESEKLQFEQRMKKTDEISAKMGDKLLLGWALLGDICPNDTCLDTPLMRDREKFYYCVSCGNRGETIKDLIPKPVQQPIQPAQQPIIVSTGVSPIKEPILKRQKKEDEIEQPIQPTRQPIQSHNNSSVYSTSSNRSISSPSISSSSPSVGLLHEEIKDMPCVVDRTLETLFNKLKDAESRLCTPSMNHDTRTDLAMIRECGLAISSLLELKKQLL